ncbi:cation:proton antiporter [Luteolibacter yonseiensis]|uniref:Cation:proton antiporter n=1 Tax=Luteolibacter yonseiensis TaxID=1144680 RepID=A0A934VDV3_9BACT|nr:cation:proton antiporter [Luteolibacter yonseiensis]MBK1817944.1 cation:proton antiporter [Luteolibacter yonseiensis]
MHDLSLISTIAAAFTVAWVLGLLTQWLKLSPIVGYLLAGVIIGPHTPGFVGDVHLAQQLAEVGVILLMFGVGLHFHLKDLIAVKNVAIPGAVGQSLIATVLAMVVFSAFGMPLTTGAVLGMAMAVASTVVLMRVLMDADVLSSRQGHVAVGWLIVEDIFTVILLVLIPVLGSEVQAAQAVAEGKTITSAGGGGLWLTLGTALLKLAVLVAIVLVAGAKVVPWALVKVARLRSRELFTLTVLVFSVAIAAASYFFFGASMALGAFLAGMVVAQSPVSHQAAADALPLRDAFAVLFFVSVGMLFDPAFLIEQPLMVAAALGIILIAKPLAALLIVAVLGHSVRTALTVAIGLAQIGEFSFILSELARQHKLMPDAGHNVLVASAIISITVNPLLFRALPQIEDWLRARPRLWKLLNGRAEKRIAQTKPMPAGPSHGEDDGKRLAIVVGYGPVGRSVHRVLKDAGLSTVVIDMNMDTVTALHAEGQVAIYGDASNQGVLEEAGMKTASHLIITLPNASHRAAVVAASRAISDSVRIVVRARYLREREELERSGASAAVFEEAEAAVALARLVLTDTGIHRQAAEQKLQDIRLHLIMDNFSNIRSQRVALVMVPWAHVRSLSTTADRQAVLNQIAQERFSRWPVVDPATRRVTGYLRTKDLLAQKEGNDWSSLIRPVKSILPNDSIDSTLTRMQEESASIYIVEDGGAPLGLVTMEDILEQVVGKLEDEDTRDKPVLLGSAVQNGGVVTSMTATNKEEAIHELIHAIPTHRLPAGFDASQIYNLVLAREEEISTDLGNGIAIPHARCPGISAPLAVVGQSKEGVVYSSGDNQAVHLFFLLITPAERPEAQLSLLRQTAKLAGTESARDAMVGANSPASMLDIIHKLLKSH